MDKRWRRYKGFSQAFGCYIDSVCDLYACVTHKRLIIQCRLASCCIKPRVTEDAICNNNLPGFWTPVKRKLTEGGFLITGTSKNRLILHFKECPSDLVLYFHKFPGWIPTLGPLLHIILSLSEAEISWLSVPGVGQAPRTLDPTLPMMQLSLLLHPPLPGKWLTQALYWKYVDFKSSSSTPSRDTL